MFGYHLKADRNGVGKERKKRVFLKWKRNYPPEEPNSKQYFQILKGYQSNSKTPHR